MATEKFATPEVAVGPATATRPAPIDPLAGRLGNGRPAARSSAAAPDSRYREVLADVRFRPVFILGAARSGTTLLYRLLAETGEFSILTAYHIFHYDEILDHYFHNSQDQAKQLLAKRFEALGLTDRLFDSVPVSPDAPEDYAGILSNKHLSCLPLVRPRSLPTFIELCKKIRFMAGEDKAVLLKNPWDYPNFAYLKEAFPDARFVFIHRNPLRVIDSQIRMIRNLVEARNEYVALLSERYRRLHGHRVVRRFLTRRAMGSPHIWRLLLYYMHRATTYYLENAPRLPAADSIAIRYEDLCEDPNQTIAGVMDFLGGHLPDGIDYRAQIQVRNGRMLPQVEQHAGRIAERQAPYFRHFGYTTAV